VRLRSLCHLLVLVAALGANASPVGAAVDAQVAIIDAPRPQARWGYAPATSRIEPGSWVTWSNSGEDTHSITATDGSFDSGDLLPSEGFSWYFDAAGTFEYLCTLHPWMLGKVVVGDGVVTAPPPPVEPAVPIEPDAPVIEPPVEPIVEPDPEIVAEA
jgi:plastocyanin